MRPEIDEIEEQVQNAIGAAAQLLIDPKTTERERQILVEVIQKLGDAVGILWN